MDNGVGVRRERNREGISGFLLKTRETRIKRRRGRLGDGDKHGGL